MSFYETTCPDAETIEVFDPRGNLVARIIEEHYPRKPRRHAYRIEGQFTEFRSATGAVMAAIHQDLANHRAA